MKIGNNNDVKLEVIANKLILASIGKLRGHERRSLIVMLRFCQMTQIPTVQDSLVLKRKEPR